MAVAVAVGVAVTVGVLVIVGVAVAWACTAIRTSAALLYCPSLAVSRSV